jgi:hypothetical protein
MYPYYSPMDEISHKYFICGFFKRCNNNEGRGKVKKLLQRPHEPS